MSTSIKVIQAKLLTELCRGPRKFKDLGIKVSGSKYELIKALNEMRELGLVFTNEKYEWQLSKNAEDRIVAAARAEIQGDDHVCETDV